MAAVIELENAEWSLIEPLFDPQGGQGAPATYSRREMVNAMLFIARTGLQWRYLPANTRPGRRSGNSGDAGATTACGRWR